jgi:hypothetical protein
MTFAVGIAFQFPLVLILLIKIGILSVRKLRENRRLVLVILMISAALITPGGDPVSLCILTIPLYILYELAILTGSIIEIRKRKKEWNEWDENTQGPKPSKPPSQEKGRWILYISIFVIISGLSFFAYQNKSFVKPWIDSFREFGKFSSTDQPIINSSSADQLSVEQNLKTIDGNDQGEFIIELLPLDQNKSIDYNKTGIFRARIIKQ